jgi:hypothetical protein
MKITINQLKNFINEELIKEYKKNNKYDVEIINKFAKLNEQSSKLLEELKKYKQEKKIEFASFDEIEAALRLMDKTMKYVNGKI